MKRLKNLKKSTRIYLGLWAAVLILNVLFWNITFLGDVYAAYVFPIWVTTVGRVMGWIPFSVGEWMLVLAAALILLLIVAVFFLAVRKGIAYFKKKSVLPKMKKVAEKYAVVCGWIFLVVAIVMTLNCFGLYHTSLLEHTIGMAGEEALTEENMVKLWNHVATRCNELSEQVVRDEKGRIIWSKEEDGLEEQAILEMQKLGEKYTRLAGYFPKPKRMYFSDFMCQQHMEGYYFPFSLEANINDVMYIINKPSALCHELAHLKGYIRENEASFVSFMACIGSEDPLFQYSGYMAVVNYCFREIISMGDEDPSLYFRYEIVPLKQQVVDDNIFVMEEDWERIEESAVVSTETVDKVSDIFIDTSLKLNGEADGMHVYARVVELLLKYFAKEGYEK